MLICEVRPNDHLEHVFPQLMRFYDVFALHGSLDVARSRRRCRWMEVKQPEAPQLGQLVRNLRGRDAGKIAAIIGIEDERFVLIADGDKRKFDQPKKKNVLHLELLPQISEEVSSSLRDTGRVTNGKLRYAITKYVEAQPSAEAQEKGE